MGRVIKFPVNASPRFKLKPVLSKKSKKGAESQLDIFKSPDSKLVQMSGSLSPFEEALIYDENGNLKARAMYEKAISMNDHSPDAWCNLGIIEYLEGNKSKAVSCFTHSLKEDPRHFEAHYNLANVYLDIENLELARLHYEVAAEIDPEHADVFYNLAVVYAMEKEFEKAIDSLENHLKLVSQKDSNDARGFLLSLKASIE
ncbi:MAG TPA: tetratricopeptide repeat protein [Cyclobacteriaceae bacterium]|jgi:tetratricopeptide (TPR) repeat protein